MIILSALGTGAYRPAHYHFPEHDQVVTSGYFAHALQQWYPEAQVIILATAGAIAGPNYSQLEEHLPDARVVEIPNGATEEECWELYDILAREIPEGEEIIFDLTHGLRHLPMLGFLALSYLSVVRQVRLQRVLYGALDLTPREGEKPLTQVLDLTPLVQLLDWAQAANRFKDTGDARLFKPLIRKQGRSPLINVANKLDVLSTALANNRTLEAADLAAQLGQHLGKAHEEEMLAQHKPFLTVMNQIEQVIAPLQAAPTAVDEVQLQAHHAQILWYFQRQHHVQAVGLAREWLVSVVLWQQTGQIQLDIDERHNAETFLGRYAKTPAQAPSKYQAICALWDNLTTLRNDLLHFGMRPITNRTKAAGIEKSVTDTIAALPAAVAPLGLSLP